VGAGLLQIPRRLHERMLKGECKTWQRYIHQGHLVQATRSQISSGTWRCQAWN